ncbi:hypothetical protein MRX96_014943 [Rhipicephalus microplus]
MSLYGKVNGKLKAPLRTQKCVRRTPVPLEMGSVRVERDARIYRLARLDRKLDTDHERCTVARDRRQMWHPGGHLALY